MTLAFVFPGQGSQSQGMLQELAASYPLVEQTFAEASAKLGFDLWQITQQGPAEKLNSTAITQPAMLAADIAVWRVWQSRGGASPEVMAGHSLGEYTALVCAGCLAFSDAIDVVAERGRLMQAAVPEGQGAMAAILGLNDEVVLQACQDAAEGEVLEAANFNSPAQVVVGGNKAAVERMVILAKERGAKRAVILPMSAPSHCALMKPAADTFTNVINAIEMRPPAVPVINNVDVTIQADVAAIRDALIRQIYNPVRWVEIIQKMAAEGVTDLIECGPGKVLLGLNKRIEKTITAAAIFDPASLDAALQH